MIFWFSGALGLEGRDFGGPQGQEQTSWSSRAASRELPCSPRSPTTPPSRRAMRSLRTLSSGKVGGGMGEGGGMGGEGQMGEGLEHSVVLSLLSLSLLQSNSRHEMEEQVLGQIPGDCAGWDSQCQPTQVSVPKCSAAWPRSQAILQAGTERSGLELRVRQCPYILQLYLQQLPIKKGEKP